MQLMFVLIWKMAQYVAYHTIIPIYFVHRIYAWVLQFILIENIIYIFNLISGKNLSPAYFLDNKNNRFYVIILYF